MRIAFYLFDGTEELDAIGPWEVLAAWATGWPDDGVECFTVSADGATVTCAKGLRIVPDHSWATAPAADVLVVTGPLTRNAREALTLAWRAMAEPKWVVALGGCALNGGPFAGAYAVEGGVEAALPVDLVVDGCPPTPDAMLSALRALLEANAA